MKRLKAGDLVEFGRVVDGGYDVAEGIALVIKTKGKTVWLDAPAPSGLKPGDYLRVVEGAK